MCSAGSCRQKTEPGLQAGAGAAGEVAIRWDMGKCVARYVDGEQTTRALYGASGRGYGSVGEDSKCMSTVSGASVREWWGRIAHTACRLTYCHQLQWAATSATLHRSWHRHGYGSERSRSCAAIQNFFCDRSRSARHLTAPTPPKTLAYPDGHSDSHGGQEERRKPRKENQDRTEACCQKRAKKLPATSDRKLTGHFLGRRPATRPCSYFP